MKYPGYEAAPLEQGLVSPIDRALFRSPAMKSPGGPAQARHIS
jgi:hypothetical protein